MNAHNQPSTQEKDELRDPRSQNGINALTQERPTESNTIEVPQINLPKGGGALRAIDEKFEVNPANGTASFSIPLPVTPGRNGFSPSLALSYNSGGGNGPYGLGWSINYPIIQRKTDKRLPRYDHEQEDTFMFSGTEDLVPFLKETTDAWTIDEQVKDGHTIKRYRPRMEGGFARIEKIQNAAEETYWRVISRENITTFFGRNPEARITDPEDLSRIFAWLPEFSFDDKGNWIWYEFKEENTENVAEDLHEANRLDGRQAFTNRYLKRIKYGNRQPYYIDPALSFDPVFPDETDEYFFELVMDYGEHDPDHPKPDEDFAWPARTDAFSSYRSGFEIRTYRLCHRILMFHLFEELDEEPCLIRSLDLNYEPSSINDSGQTEVTYLATITQTGYIRRDDGDYARKSLPPMEFSYRKLLWNTDIKTVSRDNLTNAPVGLSDHYQWADLYGEGISGILTEQGGGWYYKNNLGAAEENGAPQFSVAQEVLPKPALLGLASGVLSLQDLEANGQKQIVVDHPGLQGYFELTADQQYESFQAFESMARIDRSDPNLRLLDLDGDGQPELVMTEEHLLIWYPNNGKKGYRPAERVFKALDEEQGPAIVFADQTQSIFLADMSGDGLTDIVRIRRGEICYWANLGYGHFSSKINMSNAPRFDHPDLFNPQFLQLADISGTGATDIIYLGQQQFKAYLNLSGNTWSEAHKIDPFFPVDNYTRLSVIDLLGTGTSCIVWSSTLPDHAAAPMRYIDLMNSQKPHVLTKYINNFGKETTLEYKSSTHFYLEDKEAGKPWITKLPFPVQTIAKTIIEDKITHVRFTAEYRYHHGYYDHAEREFRGFGMVEQIDTENYESWQANNAGNLLEKSEELYQAPTLTKTWFHTGAFLDRDRILDQFAQEYWFEEYNHAFPDATLTIEEPVLGDAQVVAAETIFDTEIISKLTGEEWREALRACKGMILRREIFTLDGKANHEESLKRQAKPYTVATHNCQIQFLQPRAENVYASFLAAESEAITLHYERNETDPRIAHTLNIKIDEYGQILESASVVYPRKDENINVELPSAIQETQGKTLITYTINAYTDSDIVEDHAYRLRLPAENETYEVTNLALPQGQNLYQLTDFEPGRNNPIQYHETPRDGITQWRLIEHIRILYYDDTLTGPLPLKQFNAHGLPYESYQLAYTPDLLTELFDDKIPDTEPLLANEGRFVHSEGDANWWIRSGYPVFIRTDQGENEQTARDRFFSPVAYQSPVGAATTVDYYRDYFLLLVAGEDALGNRTEVERFDFRTLSPTRMKDINDNISEVLLDELGLVKALALLGKGDEADRLDNLTAYSTTEEEEEMITLFNTSLTTELQTAARELLQGATTRFVYDFHRYRDTAQKRAEQLANKPESPECELDKYAPTAVATISREQHDKNLPDSPLQLIFSYTDGLGNVAMTKTQAEPGEALNLVIEPDCAYTLETINTGQELRWIGNGRTVLNNKGNPVKQYEPYFSVNPFYEDHQELVERGLTPILHYDALGRNIKTELPDGTFSKIEFDSWHQASYDANDTVKESQWYLDRGSPDPQLPAPSDKKELAAWKAAQHDNTPSGVHLDTLGRPILSVAHNRIADHDEYYHTIIKLDIEGNTRQVIDHRGNTVMAYAYDMLGHRVYQNSMDAGERWMLNNVTGNPIRNWDSRGHAFSTAYDILQRPVERRLTQAGDPTSYLIEKVIYGESQTGTKADNLRGRPYQQYDSSGRITNVRFDFKGNLLEAQRQLAAAYDAEIVDWSEGSLTNSLEPETFTSLTEYDALSRMTRLYNWHRTDGRIAIIEPVYNERSILTAEDHITAAERTPNGYTGGRRITVVSDIQYNEKGQRTQMRYGNDTTTRYHYDARNFHLLQLRTTRNTTNTELPGAPSNLSDPNVLQNLYYTYDPVGNITEIEDDAYEPVFFQNQRVEPRSRYTYDALYRLVRAEGRENHNFDHAPGPQEPLPTSVSFPKTDQALRNYAQTYAYDPVGNILEMRHIANTERWTRQYEYAPDSNRLLRTWVGNDTVNTVNYQYDVHGNMLNYNNAPTEYRPEWDYRDMVYHLNLGGGGEAWYQYTTKRERSRKRIEQAGGIVEERLYLGGLEIYRRWNGNTLAEEIETHHLFVDNQRVLLVDDVLQTDNNNLATGMLDRYQYSNHLGSVGLELDGAGAIISYEEYHPYGTTAYRAVNTAIKTTAKRYRYTGMERDAESGLGYHSARYYLGWLGRWLKPDPAGLKSGLNHYQYSHNQPISRVDLNGMADENPSEKNETFRIPVTDHFVKARDELGSPMDFTNDPDVKYLTSEEYKSALLSMQNAPPTIEEVEQIVGFTLTQEELQLLSDLKWQQELITEGHTGFEMLATGFWHPIKTFEHLAPKTFIPDKLNEETYLLERFPSLFNELVDFYHSSNSTPTIKVNTLNDQQFEGKPSMARHIRTYKERKAGITQGTGRIWVTPTMFGDIPQDNTESSLRLGNFTVLAEPVSIPSESGFGQGQYRLEVWDSIGLSGDESGFFYLLSFIVKTKDVILAEYFASVDNQGKIIIKPWSERNLGGDYSARWIW